MAKKSYLDKIYDEVQSNPTPYIQKPTSSMMTYTGNTDFGQSQYDNPLTGSEEILSGEYKYIRGERQPWLDKAANGLIRLTGRAVTSGAEGILTPFVGTFYAIKDNKFSSFYDNPVAQGLDEIDKGIKESLPLYDTRESESATGFAKLKYANTLFNDIFDGIGYSLGAIGTGSTYTKLGKVIAKSALAGKVGEVISGVSKIEGAADKLTYIDKINKAYRLTDGVKNGTTAFITSVAEASANARSDKNEFKQMMAQEITKGERELTSEEQDHINQLSEQVGNNSFMFNIPTIMMDNWITFGKSIFGNKATDKLNFKALGTSLEKDGLDTYKLAKKSSIDKILDKTYGIRQLGTPFLSEGTQEQLQFAITKGTNDYFKKKYYNPDSADFMESVAKGLSEAYGTDEGWDNFLIGAISGGIMGTGTKLLTEGTKGFKNPNKESEQQALNYINQFSTSSSYKTIIETINRAANIEENKKEALKNNDTFEYENLKNDGIINYVTSRIKTGKIQDLYDDLNEFRNMNSEQFKSNFGTEFKTSDELSTFKNQVVDFMNNKIESVKKVERAYNIIDERFPDTSEANKDRLAYASLTIENSGERKAKLSEEIGKIINNNKHTLFNPTLLASLSINYNQLTTKEGKEMFIDNINNSSINPMDKQEILDKIKDIDKLTEREKAFVKEYKRLANEKYQQQLDETDKKVEEEISNVDSNKAEEVKNKIVNDEELTNDDKSFVDNNHEVITTKVSEEPLKQEVKKNKIIFDTVKKDNIVPGSQLFMSDEDGFYEPVGTITSINDNNIVIKDINDKDINTTLDDLIKSDIKVKLDDIKPENIGTASLPTDYNEQDIVSKGITKDHLITNNIPINDNNSLNYTSSIIDQKSVANISNVFMIKQYEHYKNEQGFRFIRDENGKVIKTNTNISDIINSKNINAGDTVSFKFVELSEEANRENLDRIDNSKRLIQAQVSNNLKEQLGYTDEDINFNSDVYTKSIGIYKGNQLLGYVQLPHYIDINNTENLDIAINTRKQIIANRKQIIDKLNRNEVVETKILEKGNGNLLTQIKNNKPVSQGNLFSNIREQDKTNGKIALVYDNGEGFVLNGTQDLKDKYGNFIDSLESFGNNGKVYQIVEASNTYGLIPVYSNLINENTADIIINKLKSLPSNTSYNQIINTLNDYIYAGNKLQKPNVDLNIYTNNNVIVFEINGIRTNLNDIKQDLGINEFKQALTTKRHNIAVNNINNLNYQKDLADRNVLTTNAYTDNGHYFVQPFISYDNIINVANTNLNVLGEIDSNIPVTNNIVSDFTNTLNKLKEKGIDLTGDIEDDAFSRDFKSINPVNRKQASIYLDTYFPFLTLSDLSLVSQVKGAMKDATGMLRKTTVYLFEGSNNKTLYHEAFHGVFRNLLNESEQAEVLVEAEQKYGKATREQLDHLIEEMGSYKNDLTQEDIDFLAQNKWLEENLADEFADYSDNFINRSLGQKILDFFKKILQFFNIISNTNHSQIDKLFEDMMAKKYTGKTKQQIPYSNLEKNFDVAYSRKIANLPNVTKNRRLNQISVDFSNRYYSMLAKGIKPSKNENKQIFEDILKSYINKFVDESNKQEPNENNLKILNQVITNFNEFKTQAIKQIATDYKINIKDDLDVDITNLDLENFDTEDVNLEGKTSKEYGQEFMSISGIKAASTRLKLALSFIPYLDNKGEIVKDEFGFTQYYKAENIYYWLERNLVGTYDFEEMLDRINKASVFKPELKSVYTMLTDKGTHTLESFEQFKNQFRTNFAKQQMVYLLVTFEKTPEGNKYKIINSNRQGVKTEIIDRWKNTLLNVNGQNISEVINNEVKINGTKKAQDLYKYFINNKDNIGETQLEQILSKVGITYSDNIINKILANDRTKFIKNIEQVLKYYSLEDYGSFDKIFQQAIKVLADYEFTGNINNYSSSFNNVENKAIYTIQHQSFSSKFVSKIKNDYKYENTISELRKDPINKFSNLLTELENDDKFRQEQFNVFYLNGLKDSKSEASGSKWTKMSSSDTMNMLLSLYQNTTSDQNLTTGKTVYYSNLIESDKTLHSIIQGKAYNVLLNNNMISANSDIVNKFYNVVLGEANRIKKALEIKNRIENGEENLKSKLLQYYHYSKDSSKFDGTAYRFNTIDGINELLPEIVSLLRKDFKSSVVNDLSILEPIIKNQLAKELTIIYHNTLNEAANKGLITLNPNNTYSNNTLELKTTKVDNEIRELIASFSANEYLHNIEYSNIINGDSAFYKSTNGKPSDMAKRFYQSNSQTKTLKKGVSIRVSAIDDLEESSNKETLEFIKQVVGNVPDKYSENNITDAQVWVLPDLYKSIMTAIGEWTSEYEIAHKIGEGLEVNSEAKYRNKLKAIKPFGFGYDYDKDLGINVYRQIKCSIMPLYKSYINNNPLMAEMRTKLENSNTNMLATKSSLKAALGLRDKFSSGTTTFNNNFTFNEENFGIQVDNIDHLVDSDNSSIRQAKMLIPGNIELDKTYSGRTGEAIREEINNIEAVNIDEDLKLLKTKINSSEFNIDLKESLTKRGATIATETVLTVNENGQFDYPLDFINSTATENMISSVFTNKVIKQEFTGGSAVQASAIGYKFKSSFKNIKEQQESLTNDLNKLQSDLQYIRASNEEGKIEYIDCAMPAWDNRFYNNDGSLKKIEDIPDELRTIMIYRIPTEGYHSMMMVKVKSFLPKEYGNFMLLPYEITTQFGADFDFDKTFFLTPEFEVKDDKLVKIKYDNTKSIKDNSKSARNNRLLDNYDTILRDYNTLPYLIKPSGFEDMENIAKELNIKTELPNYYTGISQRFYKDLFHSIIGLKGQSANHVTGHSFFTMMNLSIDPLYFDNQEYTSLSRLKSDNNELISEELSSMMAAILDAVKNPDLLPTLGINDKTIDIWATLVHLGVGVTKATYFTASPSIKELSNLMKIEDKKIGKEYGKNLPIDRTISKYDGLINNTLDKLTPDEQEEIKSDKLYINYKDGKYRLNSKEMLFDIKYKTGSNTKQDLMYYIRQAMLLKAYNIKIKPVSDVIVKVNKIFAVNKEVGPNIENIIDKLTLLNSIENGGDSNPDFVIRGFSHNDIPQLASYYNTNKYALDYLSKYFPYGSEQYLSIKNKISTLQFGKNLLSLDAETRMKINGAIRTAIDYNSSLFNDIKDVKTQEFLLKDLPNLISEIKKPNNDSQFFNGRLRKSAFIEQLNVIFDDKNKGFGYIGLKGNRLTETAKNEIIESGLNLFNNNNTKNLFKELIRHSFLTTGLYTGLNSYHSLIAPEVFLELGYEENTINNNLEIISDFVDYRKSKTELLNKGEKLFTEEQENLIVDQIVRNFSKQFTRTYNSEMFSILEETNKKPTKILVNEISKNKFKVSETDNINYIRVYFKDYGGSLLYKHDTDGVYNLINYLGKPGKLLELNPSNNIVNSILERNNYTSDLANIENSEETNDETGNPILEDNNYKTESENPFGQIKEVTKDDINNAKKIC